MQIRRPLARAVVVLVALGAILAATAQPASAHATFLGAPSVRVGEDVRLTLDVPHERDEETLNTKVRISLPTGWSSVSCEPFATWTCSAAGTVIEFVKQVGADPAQDETFIFSVRAGTAGLAVFPVQQIYSSGEDVLWQDTARLTASTAVAPTTSSPSGPMTSSVPGQSADPADPEDPDSAADQSVNGLSQPGESNGGGSGAVSGGLLAEDGAVDAAAADGTPSAAEDASSSGGGSDSSLPRFLAVSVTALVVAGGVAVLIGRRRRVGTSEPRT
jgi:hypothetical protein